MDTRVGTGTGTRRKKTGSLVRDTVRISAVDFSVYIRWVRGHWFVYIYVEGRAQKSCTIKKRASRLNCLGASQLGPGSQGRGAYCA